MARKKKPANRKGAGLSSRNLIVVIACIALITAGMVLLFFSLFAIFKVYDVRMELSVSNTSGINTDTDYVNFGKARAGSSNSRTIVMSHDYKRTLLVHFKKSGNISRFVVLPDDFYLEPGITREVTLTAVVPRSASDGDYEGNLRVYFRRI